jgi:peptide methionine sulfoxide reductase MsrB
MRPEHKDKRYCINSAALHFEEKGKDQIQEKE